MSPSPAGDIVFRLDTIDQLFNAPDINPFSSEQSTCWASQRLRSSSAG